MKPVVRPLRPEEWAAFKALRLAALEADPHFFATRPELEKLRPNHIWKELCRTTADQATFGLFFKKELAGIAMVSKREDMDAPLFGGAWVKPEHRNSHHANLLYDARVKWLEDNPRYAHAYVFHRIGNMKSRYLNRKHGAWPLPRLKMMRWADGTEDYGQWYRVIAARKNRTTA